MKAELHGKVKGKLDIKRFYLPGMKLNATCPRCGNVMEHSVYCPSCDHEWTIALRLNISLTLENP